MDQLKIELDALEKTVMQSEGLPGKEREQRKSKVAEFKARFNMMRDNILESINANASGAVKVTKKFDANSEEVANMSNKELKNQTQEMMESNYCS